MYRYLPAHRNNKTVLKVVHTEPHRDRLGGEAAIALRKDELAARFQHAAHLARVKG